MKRAPGSPHLGVSSPEPGLETQCEDKDFILEWEVTWEGAGH